MRVGDGVGLGVKVGDDVGVAVGVEVEVAVGVSVGVEVAVSVDVGVGVLARVGVGEGVGVGIGVGVGVGVGSGVEVGGDVGCGWTSVVVVGGSADVQAAIRTVAMAIPIVTRFAAVRVASAVGNEGCKGDSVLYVLLSGVSGRWNQLARWWAAEDFGEFGLFGLAVPVGEVQIDDGEPLVVGAFFADHFDDEVSVSAHDVDDSEWIGS